MLKRVVVMLAKNANPVVDTLNEKILHSDLRVKSVGFLPRRVSEWDTELILDHCAEYVSTTEENILIIDTDDEKPDPSFLPMWAVHVGLKEYFWRTCNGLIITPYYAGSDRKNDPGSFLLSAGVNGIGAAGVFKKCAYNVATGKREIIPDTRSMSEFSQMVAIGDIRITKDWAAIISRAIELRV